MVISFDTEDIYGPYGIHDVLSRISSAAALKNDDFDLYWKIQLLQCDGRENGLALGERHTLRRSTGISSFTSLKHCSAQGGSRIVLSSALIEAFIHRNISNRWASPAHQWHAGNLLLVEIPHQEMNVSVTNVWPVVNEHNATGIAYKPIT